VLQVLIAVLATVSRMQCLVASVPEGCSPGSWLLGAACSCMLARRHSGTLLYTLQQDLAAALMRLMSHCVWAHRKPRRLGGGKGGESRLPREPKTLMRRLKKGLPAVPGPPAAGAAAPPPERAPERERVPMPAPVQAPPPERFPVSDGRDRERERERDRAPPPRSSDRREPDRVRSRRSLAVRIRAAYQE
jgi:hypothetical protein